MTGRLELLLIAVGLIVILAGAFLAFEAYESYEAPMAGCGDVEGAVTAATLSLVDVAARIGFIALIIWAGSLILSKGIELLRKR